jgi:hypothetical protein
MLKVKIIQDGQGASFQATHISPGKQFHPFSIQRLPPINAIAAGGGLRYVQLPR